MKPSLELTISRPTDSGKEILTHDNEKLSRQARHGRRCFGSSRDFFRGDSILEWLMTFIFCMTWCLMMFLQLWRNECQLSQGITENKSIYNRYGAHCCTSAVGFWLLFLQTKWLLKFDPQRSEKKHWNSRRRRFPNLNCWGTLKGIIFPACFNLLATRFCNGAPESQSDH